jgi:cytochrome P450
MIIDECMTFFFAGSQTISAGISNMIFYMTRNPEFFNKVRNEINETIVKPYLKSNPGEELDINRGMNFDNMFELKFYNNCFYESLRIESPLTYSSTIMMTEDVQLDKYWIKKGDCIVVDMYNIHRNKE